jgi:hypothetical protein
VATLATQRVTRAGVKPTYANAASGGDKFHPGGRVFLHVKNGAGSSVTVTVATPGEVVEDVAITDLAVAVPAGEEKMIGPLPGSYFGDPSDSGLAAVTYSSATSVTIAVFEVS